MRSTPVAPDADQLLHGDFVNNYEGIGGYEGFRGELGFDVRVIARDVAPILITVNSP